MTKSEKILVEVAKKKYEEENDTLLVTLDIDTLKRITAGDYACFGSPDTLNYSCLNDCSLLEYCKCYQQLMEKEFE